MITIRLDGDPVAKGRPRFVRATGRAFTPGRTLRYEDRLGWAAQMEMAGRPLLEGALTVVMTVFVGVPKSKPKKWQIAALEGSIRPTTKPDADNLAKTLDSFNKIVWVDDAQIAELLVKKFYSDRPRVEISVDNLSPLF